MADFCKQCADEMGFSPDFAGLTTKEDEAGNLYVRVLCEGCGPIQVNHAGECITEACLRAGHAAPTPEAAP